MSGSGAAARPLGTRDALLIAFFATFLVAAPAALRWHLHVPGHAMLPTAFALVLVRSCVDRRGAGSLCGLLAGAAVAVLGMGQGGPVLVLKLALPGAVVDAVAWLRGRGAARVELGLSEGLAAGALAGLTAFVPVWIVESLAGMEPRVIALHALTSVATKVVFGAAGGWAAAWVARELRHHGVLDPSR